jgi:predicted PurR-regulated permease PerM
MLGVMFAAIIAGFFSLVSLISSKEQKVSEFRQEWINSLRESVSSYIASLSYMSTLYKHYLEQDIDKLNRFEMTKGVKEIYSTANKAYNDIVFRVNGNENKEHLREINNKFLSALEETRSLFNDNEFLKARTNCNKVRDYAKPLLKAEWERVKRGEPTYRYAKYFAASILALGILIFSFSSYRTISTLLASPNTTQGISKSAKEINQPTPANVNNTSPSVESNTTQPNKVHAETVPKA